MHISWRALAILLLAGGLPTRASGQERERAWSIGLDVGLTRFWGGSEEVEPNSALGFKPYRPTAAAVRVDRTIGRARVGLAVSYAASGLGLEGDNLTLIAKGGLTWIQVAPEVAYRLATLRAVTELRVFGGPVADLWIPDDEEGRTRIGVRGGAELLVPLSGWLACMLRAHAGLTGSLFREADVPSGFQPKTMPNVGLSLGIRFGL
jgi:hypothetical protein